jgi:hypothetical protein
MLRAGLPAWSPDFLLPPFFPCLPNIRHALPKGIISQIEIDLDLFCNNNGIFIYHYLQKNILNKNQKQNEKRHHHSINQRNGPGNCHQLCQGGYKPCHMLQEW